MASDLSRPPRGSAQATTRSQRRRRRGASAVEFALTAPLFFLLFFGFLDVGRGIMVKNLLTSAARDGARSAALDGSTVAGIEAQVTDFLSNASVNGVTVTVDPDPLTLAAIGDPVSVTVRVPFDSVSWLPSSFYFGGVTLESKIVMRRETTQ